MVGLLGIEPRPYAPKAQILPLYDSPFNFCEVCDACRSAENRTRVSHSRSVYTTAVLHSVSAHPITQYGDFKISIFFFKYAIIF